MGRTVLDGEALDGLSVEGCLEVLEGECVCSMVSDINKRGESGYAH